MSSFKNDKEGTKYPETAVRHGPPPKAKTGWRRAVSARRWGGDARREAARDRDEARRAGVMEARRAGEASRQAAEQAKREGEQRSR